MASRSVSDILYVVDRLGLGNCAACSVVSKLKAVTVIWRAHFCVKGLSLIIVIGARTAGWVFGKTKSAPIVLVRPDDRHFFKCFPPGGHAHASYSCAKPIVMLSGANAPAIRRRFTPALAPVSRTSAFPDRAVLRTIAKLHKDIIKSPSKDHSATS
ncbi:MULTISPECIES: hypothetical protein [Bradyrhizobium]|uniref:hypothetical protein n=1 Tax=Bradyrhizobium TaxID=374 RepID=UPI000944CB7F|nr:MULTISPECIES: hypothetical protein [Bradyrhizobium]